LSAKEIDIMARQSSPAELLEALRNIRAALDRVKLGNAATAWMELGAISYLTDEALDPGSGFDRIAL
jgi:hypothetical protein